MGVEKVTGMVLKVDLQCPRCYKKIKKTLCKYPQIRNQVYDEKANTVAITVVCCSPEKIRDKLCARGGKVIKSIEIIQPPKPKDSDKSKEKPKVVVVEQPKDAGKPKEGGEKPKSDGKGDKPKPDAAPAAAKPAEKTKEAPKAEQAAKPPPGELVKAPVNGVPSVFPYIGPTYDSYGTGPYYHGYGFPPPPQPCYEGYFGYGHGHGHGYGYGYGRPVGNVNRCDSYFGEENPQACSIM